jgi:serine/threonine protein kinase
MSDHFEILTQVGEGTYGQVYKARDRATGEIVALKKCKLEKATEGFPVTAIREIKILRALKHVNIVDLKEIATSRPRSRQQRGGSGGGADQVAGGGGGEEATANSHGLDIDEDEEGRGSVYLVFEYLEYDLTGLLKGDIGVTLTPMHIKCYMKQLLEGVHTAHKNNILHRDIKCSNLLIGNDGYLKIGDWGLARPTNETLFKNMTTEVITLWYRPPELLLHDTTKAASKRSQYTSAVDMWSVGCIFAEMLHKKEILPGANELEQLEKIFALCGTPNEQTWPGIEKLDHYEKFRGTGDIASKLQHKFKLFPPDALSLVERLLTLDPAKRISAHEALDHDYFWTDPLPCEPGDLPKFQIESIHEFEANARRQEAAKAQHAARQQHAQGGGVRPGGARPGGARPPSRPMSAAAKAALAAGSGPGR